MAQENFSWAHENPNHEKIATIFLWSRDNPNHIKFWKFSLVRGNPNLDITVRGMWTLWEIKKNRALCKITYLCTFNVYFLCLQAKHSLSSSNITNHEILRIFVLKFYVKRIIFDRKSVFFSEKHIFSIWKYFRIRFFESNRGLLIYVFAHAKV